MDRSIDPLGAVDGVARGVGDGEATADGDGAVADGLELGGVGESTALGALGAWAVDVGVLPHAAMDISATIGAKRQTRFLTGICKG